MATEQPQLHGAPGQTSATEPKPPNDKPIEQLRWYLENEQSRYRARLAAMLGKRAPQFVSSVLSLANSSTSYKNVEPKSIIASAVIAATLDLPIDRNMGFAWIVPYGNLAQFQIGYKGWIQLALRTGRYAGIINFSLLDRSKPAIGYGFAWRLTTGFVKIVYWKRADVETHARRYSKAYQYGLANPSNSKAQQSPWFTHFDEMGLKTVISNSLRRWGIMSVEYQELQLAYERDQSAAYDMDAEPLYPDNDERAENAGGAAVEPIREPRARQQPASTVPEPRALDAPKEPAGMTVEDFTTLPRMNELLSGAKPETRLEKVMLGKAQPKTNDEKRARAMFVEYQNDPKGQNVIDAAQTAGASAELVENMGWLEKDEKGDFQVKDEPGEDKPRIDDGTVASAGALKIIRTKMNRATLTLNDLRKVPGFTTLESLEALKASEVNTVLKWIDDPVGFKGE
jgi:recombination protein RecT